MSLRERLFQPVSPWSVWVTLGLLAIEMGVACGRAWVFAQ